MLLLSVVASGSADQSQHDESQHDKSRGQESHCKLIGGILLSLLIGRSSSSVCTERRRIKRVNIFRVFFSTLLAVMAARCKTVYYRYRSSVAL